MMNTIPIREWLSGQSEGLDLDLVRKMVIQPVLVPERKPDSDKTKRGLAYIQIRRIEWWDSERPNEISTLTVAGNPKLIIRLLAKYKRSNKPVSSPSSTNVESSSRPPKKNTEETWNSLARLQSSWLRER